MKQSAQNAGVRTPNGHPGAPSMPQIRTQVNISGQQQRISNAMLNNSRISSQNIQAQQAAAVAQAQARALAAAQAAQNGQPHPGIASSLAAGAAPALQAHLSPTYNAARANSTSPGVPQQSPPLPQATVNSVTSPRPPSAQAQASAVMAHSIATAQRASAPTLAHYYSNLNMSLTTGQFTNEQVRAILTQVSIPKGINIVQYLFLSL